MFLDEYGIKVYTISDKAVAGIRSSEDVLQKVRAEAIEISTAETEAKQREMQEVLDLAQTVVNLLHSELCWFCERGVVESAPVIAQGVRKPALALGPEYRFPVLDKLGVYDPTLLRVEVPRCGRCKHIHNFAKALAIVVFLLALVVVIGGLTFLFHQESQPMTAIDLFVPPVVALVVASSLAWYIERRIQFSGVKPMVYALKHPNVRDLQKLCHSKIYLAESAGTASKAPIPKSSVTDKQRTVQVLRADGDKREAHHEQILQENSFVKKCVCGKRYPASAARCLWCGRSSEQDRETD